MLDPWVRVASPPRVASGRPVGRAAAGAAEAPAPLSPLADYDRAASRSRPAAREHGGDQRSRRTRKRSGGPWPKAGQARLGAGGDHPRQEARHLSTTHLRGDEVGMRAEADHLRRDRRRPSRQGERDVEPGQVRVMCTAHPACGLRTLKNMVRDGNGWKCTPRHACLGARSEAAKRNQPPLRIRSRSRDRRHHRRQPPAQ